MSNEAANQARTRRLRSSGRSKAPRRYAKRVFRISWLTFIVSFILFGVGSTDEAAEGVRAVLLILVLFVLLVSLCVAVLVTFYRAINAFLDANEPQESSDAPQDLMPSAVLHSGSVVPLVALSLMWVLFIIFASALLGLAGFVISSVSGLVLILVATYLLNVMDQRVHVESHQVRMWTLRGRRTISASAVTDVEFLEPNLTGHGRRLVFHRKNAKPVHLQGNFVSDPIRAREFVEQSRQILRLDEARGEAPRDQIR